MTGAKIRASDHARRSRSRHSSRSFQNGYRADSVLRVCVSSINGIDNAYGATGSARPGSPYFARELIEHLSPLAARKPPRDSAHHGETRRPPLVMKLRPGRTPEMIGRDVRLHQLLGLDPSTNEFTIVPGLFPGSPREVAFATRSMLRVMLDIASYIEVPQSSDVTDGRVYEPPRTTEQLRQYPPLLRIHSGDQEPQDCVRLGAIPKSQVLAGRSRRSDSKTAFELLDADVLADGSDRRVRLEADLTISTLTPSERPPRQLPPHGSTRTILSFVALEPGAGYATLPSGKPMNSW